MVDNTITISFLFLINIMISQRTLELSQRHEKLDQTANAWVPDNSTRQDYPLSNMHHGRIKPDTANLFKTDARLESQPHINAVCLQIWTDWAIFGTHAPPELAKEESHQKSPKVGRF